MLYKHFPIALISPNHLFLLALFFFFHFSPPKSQRIFKILCVQIRTLFIWFPFSFSVINSFAKCISKNLRNTRSMTSSLLTPGTLQSRQNWDTQIGKFVYRVLFSSSIWYQ